MEFTLKRQEIVLPLPPVAPHVVTLSENDQIMPPLYTSFVYFFSPPSNPPQSASLTLALARALAAFPPVGGRLKARSNGTGMDVECHNQGVVFVEAHAAATLDQLLNTGKGDVRGGMYQPSPLWTSLAPNPYEDQSLDKPLLYTQLTRLACGGVVVVVMLHHVVADGAGLSHFVASWAELAREHPITAPPHLDRACMQARTPPCPSFDHPEYIVHQTIPSFSLSATAQPPPMTSRIFEFLPQDIATLKERASKADSNPVTGFQALAAHIWKHATKARAIESAQEVKLGWAVDGRKRFDNPALPTNYFGNVNFYGYAEATAGEVAAQPLRDVAALVASGTQRVTDAYMRSALDLVASQASPALVTGSFVGAADLALTSWTHFPAYDVDWGWGRPVFFGVPVCAFTGLAVLLPHPRGGVNALVGMFQSHMDALLSDSDFYPVE
ncbi:hypothetical protein M758_4G138100 [Ceratodon purpureus]|nr:hypothetical protein M758_4G138100 [Ceratodon purpureus]